MNGYLMDTNHVTAWEGNHPVLLARLSGLPEKTLVYASAISLGEMAAGHEMTNGDAQRRHQVKQFLSLNVIPDSIPVSHYTHTYYGQIIGRIWKKHPPASAKTDSDVHLVKLGVNMNDVWIVASAWEHGLIFLTADKMAIIRDVTPEVTFDNWLI